MGFCSLRDPRKKVQVKQQGPLGSGHQRSYFTILPTVALNFQTPGYEMDLNAGRFLVNGRCGYILKPSCLRQPDTMFDPRCPGPPSTTLTVQVGKGSGCSGKHTGLSGGQGNRDGLDIRVCRGQIWAWLQTRTAHLPQVLTAQQLPKLNAEKPSSIVDPLVRVEIHGVPADCARKETSYVLNNGGHQPGEQ